MSFSESVFLERFSGVPGLIPAKELELLPGFLDGRFVEVLKVVCSWRSPEVGNFFAKRWFHHKALLR